MGSRGPGTPLEPTLRPPGSRDSGSRPWPRGRTPRPSPRARRASSFSSPCGARRPRRPSAPSARRSRQATAGPSTSTWSTSTSPMHRSVPTRGPSPPSCSRSSGAGASTSWWRSAPRRFQFLLENRTDPPPGAPVVFFDTLRAAVEDLRLASGRDRDLRGARGTAHGRGGPRSPPERPTGGARRGRFTPRPHRRGLLPEARRGASPRNRDRLAQRDAARRAAPAARRAAPGQRGVLRLLPGRLPGPVHDRPGRARPRDPRLLRPGVRALGDLPGPRHRGRGHGAAGDLRGAGPPASPSASFGARRLRPSRRSRSRPASSCSTGGSSSAGGSTKAAFPRAASSSSARETLWSERKGLILGGARRAPGAGAAHRRPPLRAPGPPGRRGRDPGGGAALPHGRRLHARLGVLEAARRLLRLHVALVPAKDRARGGGVREAAVAARRDRRGGGQAAVERARRAGPGGRERGAARVPHPRGRRTGALDGPRLLAGHRPGRDVPRGARLEPGRHRRRSSRRSSCGTPSSRSSACASGSRSTTRTCGSRWSRHPGFDEIIGRSAVLRQALTRVQQVAPTSSTVLLQGETGVGKELVAHAIHDLSPRRDGPSSSSTARRCPPRSSRASSSGTRRAPSPAPSPGARGASRSRTAPPSSSTRSASCRSSCRPSSCA